jgi:hypothetical protein
MSELEGWRVQERERESSREFKRKRVQERERELESWRNEEQS